MQVFFFHVVLSGLKKHPLTTMSLCSSLTDGSKLNATEICRPGQRSVFIILLSLVIMCYSLASLVLLIHLKCHASRTFQLSSAEMLPDYGRNALSQWSPQHNVYQVVCEFTDLAGWFPFQGHATEKKCMWCDVFYIAYFSIISWQLTTCIQLFWLVLVSYKTKH